MLSAVGVALSLFGAIGLFAGLAMRYVCANSGFSDHDTIGLGEAAEATGTMGGGMIAAVGGVLFLLGIICLPIGIRILKQAKEDAPPPA